MAFWLIALIASTCWLIGATLLRSPYFLGFRIEAFWLWVMAGLLAVAGMLWWKRYRFTGFRYVILLPVSAMLIGAVIAGYGRWRHQMNRALVEETPSARMPEVGRHLMIGWLGLQETSALAQKNAIVGVFLTSRDFPEGTTIPDIRNLVDQLQAVRKRAGLPVLWIATDQEGGPVEKLSPPLPRQRALAKEIPGLDREGIISRVRQYADEQGVYLAEAGINMNFAPVVDLMPQEKPGALDIHSRIATRAFSADPEIVTMVAQTYVTTMEGHGIKSILKHFPGLGSVPEDTHHFSASIDVPTHHLESKDWIPFRKITGATSAGIMLGHVKLTTIDPVNPASCSRLIIHDLLRKQWGCSGLLVTDDFSMTPIFHGKGGISLAAEKSINAGVDVILLSYDSEAAYDLLADSIRRAEF